MTAPAAAVEAERLGLECLQPADINDPAVLERLQDVGASILVVASYGQIFRQPLLDSLLCLNIHASLLPAYRGAAPIERALAAGEAHTGVSIMHMTERLDEGPWALQSSISLGLRDDAGSVGRSLAVLGAIGVDQVLTGLSDGTVTWVEQQGPSTYADKVCAADCLLDTARGARAVHDQVRSLSPGVGARAASQDLGFKVWRTWPYGQPGLGAVPGEGAEVAGRPGQLQVADSRLFVGCAEGAVELLMVQPGGKGKMAVSAFLRGYSRRLGDRLERPADDCRPDCND
jgi:methionyl-tRNA formyltransferase